MKKDEIKWFDNATIYHVLIDRFNGGWPHRPKSVNAFCGGTLRGVIEKLGYIKSLGFTVIMLSPFFKSAVYHCYHTESYDEVDPHFGTNEDLQELIDKAHELGIRVICDVVSNHCSYWNPLFQEALLPNGGKHRDWFHFKNYDSDEFVSFLNLPGIPKFNLENTDAANYVASKYVRLAEMGFDGFRIDHAIGQPPAFLKMLCEKLKAVRSDAVVFGEAWVGGISKELYSQLYLEKLPCYDEPASPLQKVCRLFSSILKIEHPAEDKVKTITQEEVQALYTGVLDGVLDFTYRNLLIEEIQHGRRIIGNQRLREKVIRHFNNYPFDYKLVLFLDNHDTNRFLFECDNDVSLLEEAIAFTKSLNRPFSILYGTEQLMTTRTSIFDGEPYADLRVRQCMDWTQSPVNILMV